MAYSAEEILSGVGDKQGWNTDSKLLLALEYIENQGDNDAFADFVNEAAARENDH